MNHILVTGAAGGMGRAICNRLKDYGYTVYGIDYREPETDLGVKFYTCDVTKTDSITAVYEAIEKECTHLDAIVHTAGIYDLDSLIEMTEERFTRIFDINLFGIYRVNKIFKPMLSDGSRIIITSSELAPLDPLPFTGIYGITKAAVEKYAFSLRQELNLLGIKVSVIRPGAVKTGLLNVSTVALDRFIENTKLYNANANRFKKIVDSVEAKNVSPEEIADAVDAALTDKCPKYIYNVNRNPLLRLLNAMPDHAQVAVIKMILK